MMVMNTATFYICYDGIRVYEDENETPTTPMILLTTSINMSDKLLNNTSKITYTHDSHSNGHSTTPSTVIMRNTTTSDGPNAKVTTIKPWSLNGTRLNVSTSIRQQQQQQQQQQLDESRKNWQPSKMTHETPNKFIPSPELIVDSSLSSESYEKFVINNHRYVLPSRNNLAANVSQDNAKFINGSAQYSLSTTPVDSVLRGSVLNENDKLPWPIPYEKYVREFKWKTIKPTKQPSSSPPSLTFKRNYINWNYTLNDNNLKVLPNEIETISNISSFTSDSVAPINTYPTLSTSVYHPYVFENIHASPYFYPSQQPPEFSTYQPSDNSVDDDDDDAIFVHAQPIKLQNDTNLEYINAKENTIPVQRINKEVLWRTAFKWFATAIPIGLIISALVPNVVMVNTNSIPSYPNTVYPRPYYLKSNPKLMNIQKGSNRFERLTHDRQKYAQFLEKSKQLKRIGSHSGASSCENRYLCELGTVAVKEKNATKSAHTLYKALWRISNEQPNQKSLDDMNTIFKAIQDKNCQQFQCVL